MRVVVLLKQVPDIVSDRRLGASGLLERTPADAVLNEIDEAALEIALRAAESLGAQVTAVTLGPAGAVGVVRKALQVGAAAGVHVVDDAFAGSDAIGTARALAAAVRVLDGEDTAGLVVAGATALDGLGSVVPALVAAELGWPVASYATAVDVAAEAGEITVQRETEDGSETLRAALPAVVSITDTVATLRAPSFQTMLAARKAQVRELTAADLGLAADEAGLAGARAVVSQAQPRPPRPPARVVTSDGAAALVEFVAERGLLEVGA